MILHEMLFLNEMVCQEMMQWSIETGHWPDRSFEFIVDAHAEAMGWKQEGFSGMEIY